MGVTLLISLVAVVFLIILCFAFLFQKSGSKPQVLENAPRPAPNRVRHGVPRRAQLARNRGARLRANVPLDEEDNHNERGNDIEIPDGKIGAKKKAKLEAKAEKKSPA